MPVPLGDIDPAMRELGAVYAQLDLELDGEQIECRRCGRCCNFRDNDYDLFASWLERALIEQFAQGAPELKPDGSCGWQCDGLCGIHAVRPLGCRTAFCDVRWAGRQQELYERYRAKLIEICQRYDLPWDYRAVFG